MDAQQSITQARAGMEEERPINREPKPSASTARNTYLAGGQQPAPMPRQSVQDHLNQIHEMRERQRQTLLNASPFGAPPADPMSTGQERQR